MEDIIAMIDSLILEHDELITNMRNLEHIATDLGVAFQLEEAKEALVLGRLGGQEDSLKKLEEVLTEAESKIRAHFNREERGLLKAFEHSGKHMLASALHELLLEHKELRHRIASSRKEMAELRSSELSRDVWEGKAWGIRVYLTHTRRLLEDHAHSEYDLLQKARGELAK